MFRVAPVGRGGGSDESPGHVGVNVLLHVRVLVHDPDVAARGGQQVDEGAPAGLGRVRTGADQHPQVWHQRQRQDEVAGDGEHRIGAGLVECVDDDPQGPVQVADRLDKLVAGPPAAVRGRQIEPGGEKFAAFGEGLVLRVQRDVDEPFDGHGGGLGTVQRALLLREDTVVGVGERGDPAEDRRFARSRRAGEHAQTARPALAEPGHHLTEQFRPADEVPAGLVDLDAPRGPPEMVAQPAVEDASLAVPLGEGVRWWQPGERLRVGEHGLRVAVRAVDRERRPQAELLDRPEHFVRVDLEVAGVPGSSGAAFLEHSDEPLREMTVLNTLEGSACGDDLDGGAYFLGLLRERVFEGTAQFGGRGSGVAGVHDDQGVREVPLRHDRRERLRGHGVQAGEVLRGRILDQEIVAGGRACPVAGPVQDERPSASGSRS